MKSEGIREKRRAEKSRRPRKRPKTYVILLTVWRRSSFMVSALAWEVLWRFLTSACNSLAFFCSTRNWLYTSRESRRSARVSCQSGVVISLLVDCLHWQLSLTPSFVDCLPWISPLVASFLVDTLPLLLNPFFGVSLPSDSLTWLLLPSLTLPWLLLSWLTLTFGYYLHHWLSPLVTPPLRSSALVSSITLISLSTLWKTVSGTSSWFMEFHTCKVRAVQGTWH